MDYSKLAYRTALGLSLCLLLTSACGAQYTAMPAGL